jgi:hypothetical protein
MTKEAFTEEEELELEVAMKKGGPIKISVRTCNNQAVEIMDAPNAGKKGFMLDLCTYNNRYEFRFLEIPSLKSTYLNADRGSMVRFLTEDEKAEYVTKKALAELIRSIPVSGCTIGTDPEVFVVNEHGVIVPAFTFLPDKKHGNPFWDGFQAEFTSDIGGRKDWHSCLAYLTDDVQKGLKQVKTKANDKFGDKVHLTWKTVLEIPQAVMAKADEKHWELGCAPSRNVYPSIKPLAGIDGSALPIRFAGCHMHFGHGKLNDETLTRMIKALDAIYGVMTVSLFAGMEDPVRRRYYGRAGEHRLPNHGVEYRVTSSAMIAHPVLFHLCFDIARMVTYIGMAVPKIRDIWAYDGDAQIMDIINTYDVPAARDLLKRNHNAFESLIGRRYVAGKENAMKLIEHGAMGLLPLDDMEKNWLLRGKRTWNAHSEATNCCVYRSALKGTKGDGDIRGEEE